MRGLPELPARECPWFLVFVENEASSGNFDIELLDDLVERFASFEDLLDKQYAFLG